MYFILDIWFDIVEQSKLKSESNFNYSTNKILMSASTLIISNSKSLSLSLSQLSFVSVMTPCLTVNKYTYINIYKLIVLYKLLQLSYSLYHIAINSSTFFSFLFPPRETKSSFYFFPHFFFLLFFSLQLDRRG